jgi:hypothetical protein
VTVSEVWHEPAVLIRNLLPLVVLPMLASCGPPVSISRMAYFPPRVADCPLTIVNGVMTNPAAFMMPTSEWEMVGTVATGQVGSADPFSEETMKIVRPAACGMGGDAISVMMSNQVMAGFSTTTGTGYVVLRKRGGAAPVSVSAASTTAH